MIRQVHILLVASVCLLAQSSHPPHPLTTHTPVTLPPPPPLLSPIGVVKGLEESMSSGSLAGFPVVDVTATLYDGSYHEVDSSALAFQIAARGAFRDAMSKCSAKLLEPVMKVREGGGVL